MKLASYRGLINHNEMPSWNGLKTHAYSVKYLNDKNRGMSEFYIFFKNVGTCSLEEMDED
jgi:hypothetical protein